MDPRKMFQVLILGGAALTLGSVSCGGSDNPPASADAGSDAGQSVNDAGSDAGQAGNDAGSDAGSDAGVDAGTDAGVDAGSDAGMQCSCSPDPAWPGQDCGEVGGAAAVCCWLHATAVCCP